MISDINEFYKDKNILIIGASSGIGKAICQELSKYEVNLYLTSRKVDNLKQMEQDVLNTKAYRVDLSEEDSIRILFNRIDDIDIIINLAGYDLIKPFLEINKKELINISKTNFESTATLMQYALNNLGGNGIYAQVNAFSGGKLSLPYLSIDCATRAATTTLCKSLRREFSDTNTRIVLFSLPLMDTKTGLENADIWEITGMKLYDRKIVAREFIEKLALDKDDIILGSTAEKIMGYIDILNPALADVLFYNDFTNKLKGYFKSREVDDDE